MKKQHLLTFKYVYTYLNNIHKYKIYLFKYILLSSADHSDKVHTVHAVSGMQKNSEMGSIYMGARLNRVGIERG